MVQPSQDRSLPLTLVIFGRPGSGKTTVANAAVDMIARNKPHLQCLALDLDVCVPQWMRDNFAKGKYPTLEERREFALACCNYVEECFGKIWGKEGATSLTTSWVSVISFSFVNKDLRDSFRSSFPSAQWVLVETDETEAAIRINQREGHFYKGKSQDLVANQREQGLPEGKPGPDLDNSDWSFAPVDFPHVVLDGKCSIEANAASIVRFIETLLGDAAGC